MPMLSMGLPRLGVVDGMDEDPKKAGTKWKSSTSQDDFPGLLYNTLCVMSSWCSWTAWRSSEQVRQQKGRLGTARLVGLDGET